MIWQRYEKLFKIWLQCVTLSLNQVSLFGAGLVVAFTADVVEGEEQMVFFVELGWQLNLKLRNKR